MDVQSLGGISYDGETIDFYPSTFDPFTLAAMVQDFVTLCSRAKTGENVKAPHGSSMCFDADFHCHSNCKSHFILEFREDRSFDFSVDSKDFGQTVFEVLERLVEDHDALMHACGYHDRNCSGKIRKLDARHRL